MSNKKEKKRTNDTIPSSEPSSPFSFEFIFPLPLDSSNHFRPSLYTTFLSLSLFFVFSPPTLLFLFPRRKYRQGYRGVLREDLVFTWPETRYPRYTQGCLPTCFTLAVKIRLSAHGLFLATSRASSTLVGGVLFFRWLAKLARTDSISNYGHSISPE